MKLGIMQPYFFPYLGYFALIKHTDYWIVFDTVQFIRHGWIERNRILKPSGGWQYIKVPLEKHPRDAKIKDVRIAQTQDWRKRMLAQMTHYKKRAPYYEPVLNLVKQAISLETDSIVALDTHALSAVCHYLDIDFNYKIFSNSNITIGDVNAPDEWALEIAKALGAKEYYNPPGGKDLFDTRKYRENGIVLKFLDLNVRPYNQRRTLFEPALSIIDVMMFNSPDEIREMLDDYEFK